MTGNRYISPNINGRKNLASCLLTSCFSEDIGAFPLIAVFIVMIWFYSFMCLPGIPYKYQCEDIAVTDFYYIKDSKGYVLFDKTTGESYDLHDRYMPYSIWSCFSGAPAYGHIANFLDNAQTIDLEVYKGDIVTMESDCGDFAENFSWWEMLSTEMIYEFALMFTTLLPAWFIGGALVHITSRRSTSQKPLREIAKNFSKQGAIIEY